MPDYRSMFDRDYIGAWDLTTDVDIKILAVKAVELTSAQGKNKKPVVEFETDRGKSKRGFVLNKTNCVSIVAITGSTEVSDWTGHWITIFATTTEVAGKVEDCIRVRPQAPERDK